MKEDKNVYLIKANSANHFSNMYLCDLTGTLSHLEDDAVIFLNESVADKVAGKLERIYEEMNIVISAYVAKVNFTDLKRSISIAELK